MAIDIITIPEKVAEGGEVILEAKMDDPKEDIKNYRFIWTLKPSALRLTDPLDQQEGPVVHMSTKGVPPGTGYSIAVQAVPKTPGFTPPNPTSFYQGAAKFEVLPHPLASGDSLAISMKRHENPMTADLALWVAIRNTTNAIAFNPYMEFIDGVMCCTTDLREPKLLKNRSFESRLPFPGVDAYNLLKVATEIFLMDRCGVAIDIDVNDLDAARFRTRSFVGSVNELEETRRFNRDTNQALVEELWARYVKVVYQDASVVPPFDTKEELDRARKSAVPTLPYLALIRAKLKDVPVKPDTFNADERRQVDNCFGILQSKLAHPCFLELIWSYWHEEGMLVQSLNAINLRFQNRRAAGERDPLAHLELDPLRPLNNLLWGYIQDEQHRLTLLRRAYEYDHHYGLALDGKAVGTVRGADTRSKFIEAFHNLLHLCAVFFKEDDDTMVIADGFPILNSLKEVHLLLTQGHHNQYGDLPWNARLEMLMQEWLLARPEMREFLTSRIMVAYPEPWMERVDTMKKLQGWSDTPVTHFRDLGVFGEQILLSARFGAWSTIHDSVHAANWARYWRPEIQGYIHGYRAVSGIDLTIEPVDSAPPSVHLRKRLAAQTAAR
ncbi:MAG: hypothetical protein L0Y72_31265 [Gemmataceae bacterium]|nr:hypothetical protein [Gemmataceae bacterium]MCI0743531.1 hypothetical protein [Gemmataceae bacterium]